MDMSAERPTLNVATLPNFLVIGAYRSGTTTLYHHLAAHPQVYVPRVKEPNYFAFCDGVEVGNPGAARSIRTFAGYMHLFREVGDERAVGEVSPEYLVSEAAPRHIAATVPGAKLVAVLRNPVERAYSDFMMYRRDRTERCEDFGDALDHQDERWGQGQPTGAYVRTGFYGAQLARYLSVFPRAQLSIHLFDDMATDAGRVMAEIYAFLGVDDVPFDGRQHHNASGIPSNATVRAAYALRRHAAPLVRAAVPGRAQAHIERFLQRGLAKAPLPARHRARLVEIYRDDVAVLSDLLGRDLSFWLT